MFHILKGVSSKITIDANNLNGGIMLRCPLLLKDFKLVEDNSLYEIFQNEDEGILVSRLKSIWSTLMNYMINMQTIHSYQTRKQSIS